jgi:uncharacterized membrane protein YidH (DUF202 family)
VTLPEPGGQHPADPADATERTYLSWQRTGLAFAALGALLVHATGGTRHPLAAVPGLASLLAGALILLRGLLRYRSLAAAARGSARAASPGLLAGVAAAAAVLGLAMLALLAAAL